MNLQLSIPDFEHSQAIDTLLRDHANQLKKFCDDIVACHIVVKFESKHPGKGKLYNVRINIDLPGKKLAVNREANKDFAIAARDAFDVAKRQIEDYVRQKRN